MADGFTVDVFELIDLARSVQAVSGAIGDTRQDGLLGLELPLDAFGDTQAARAAWQAHREVVGSGDDAVGQTADALAETGQALDLAAAAYRRNDEALASTFLGIVPNVVV